MLGSRKITATLAGEILERSVTNSCPHGRVLLPLLCSLVKDKLITGPNDLMSGCYTLGYADDIAILICGNS
jgi:hypothetical protein